MFVEKVFASFDWFFLWYNFFFFNWFIMCILNWYLFYLEYSISIFFLLSKWILNQYLSFIINKFYDWIFILIWKFPENSKKNMKLICLMLS